MNQNSASWGIVMTVDEPAGLILANIAWHIALGAAEIHLYFDNPETEQLKAVAPLEQVAATVCGPAYWSLFPKGRPHRHEMRQVVNARDAYSVAQVDWLLHCDADEFLWWGPDGVDLLRQVGPDVDAVVLPVAERVHIPADKGMSVLEGAFRRPFRGQAARGRRLFGADYGLTNRGLTGHAQGKAFARTGRGLRLSIHRPRPAQRGAEAVLHKVQPAGSELLHIEGLTPYHWAQKLTRMADQAADQDGMPLSPHRAALAERLRKRPDLALSLYRRLKHPTVPQEAALRRLKLWAEPAFDPAAALAKVFPGLDVNLHPQDIDRWARARVSTKA